MNDGARPRVWPWAVALLLVAVPFDPWWLDWEAARRGVAMLVGAVGAVALAVGALRGRAAAPALSWPLLGLLALAAWYACRSFGGGGASGEGLLRAAWWLLLAVAFAAGARSEPLVLLRAATPAGFAIAAYGLLQGAGVDPLMPLFVVDPVATLGNRNVASEVATVLGAGIALLVAAGNARALDRVTLVLLVAYVVVNGSLSGLIALPIACALILLNRGAFGGRRSRALPALVLLGAALGFGLDALRGDGGPMPEASADVAVSEVRAEPSSPPSTTAVRVEITKAALAMAAERPLFGHGAGSFAREYPRHRSQREIELSTAGRSFPARVDTAHDDWLEILVETGGVGFLLWLGTVLALVVPNVRRVAWLAPLVALLLLAVPRSPLGNAPAAAWTFAFAGTLARGNGVRLPAWLRGRFPRGALLALAAAALVASGLPLLAGHLFAARCVEAITTARRAGQPTTCDLGPALAWLRFDARLQALAARLEAERGWQQGIATLAAGGGEGDPSLVPARTALQFAAPHLAALRRLDPYNTTVLVHGAELHFRAEDFAAAESLLRQALALDPRHPRALLLLAHVLASRGDLQGALALLKDDAHPRVAEVLPQELPELRFRAAAALLRRDPTSAAADAAVHAIEAAAPDPGRVDPRWAVLRALQDLARHRPRPVLAAWAVRAKQLGLELSFDDRRRLGPLLQALQAVPEWQPFLER